MAAHGLPYLLHAGFAASEICGILVPQPGIEPASPALEGGVLITGPPRNPLSFLFIKTADFELSFGVKNSLPLEGKLHYCVCLSPFKIKTLSCRLVTKSVTKSCTTLCDPMDCSPQIPLSIEFSRQEYWSGLLFLHAGDLPDPGIKPMCLASGFFATAPPGKPSVHLLT